MQANNIESKQLFNAIHNKTMTIHKIKGMDQLKIGQRGEIVKVNQTRREGKDRRNSWAKVMENWKLVEVASESMTASSGLMVV